MNVVPPRCRGISLSVLAASGLVGLLVGGCSPTASGGAGGLAPGLVARMDAPGATLDRAQALNIINAYRSTVGVRALSADARLDSLAQNLASQYASSGTPPSLPEGAVAMRLSAGYATFADTFSGWRNSPDDGRVLTAGHASRAGVAVATNPASNYGVYSVLVLDD